MTRTILALALTLLPGVAAACAGCFTGEGPNARAYQIATALMLVVPVALVGGLVWWVRHEHRARKAERDAEDGRER